MSVCRSPGGEDEGRGAARGVSQGPQEGLVSGGHSAANGVERKPTALADSPPEPLVALIRHADQMWSHPWCDPALGLLFCLGEGGGSIVLLTASFDGSVSVGCYIC